jgi:hypothetical protein
MAAILLAQLQTQRSKCRPHERSDVRVRRDRPRLRFEYRRYQPPHIVLLMRATTPSPHSTTRRRRARPNRHPVRSRQLRHRHVVQARRSCHEHRRSRQISSSNFLGARGGLAGHVRRSSTSEGERRHLRGAAGLRGIYHRRAFARPVGQSVLRALRTNPSSATSRRSWRRRRPSALPAPSRSNAWS